MPSDPWRQGDGVHPALKVAGMPEWEDCGKVVRLVNSGGVWFVEYDDLGARPPKVSARAHGVTPHEAAAIIEKWLREWLEQRNIYLVLGRDGYRPRYGSGADMWDADQTYPTYPEAQQAAVMAAKEPEP